MTNFLRNVLGWALTALTPLLAIILIFIVAPLQATYLSLCRDRLYRGRWMSFCAELAYSTKDIADLMTWFFCRIGGLSNG